MKDFAYTTRIYKQRIRGLVMRIMVGVAGDLLGSLVVSGG